MCVWYIHVYFVCTTEDREREGMGREKKRRNRRQTLGEKKFHWVPPYVYCSSLFTSNITLLRFNFLTQINCIHVGGGEVFMGIPSPIDSCFFFPLHGILFHRTQSYYRYPRLIHTLEKLLSTPRCKEAPCLHS